MSMKTLENATEADLLAELEKRKIRKPPMPPELASPDWSKVHQTVVNGVRQANENGYEGDLRYYVYEAAMEAVYGTDFWKWWNARFP